MDIVFSKTFFFFITFGSMFSVSQDSQGCTNCVNMFTIHQGGPNYELLDGGWCGPNCRHFKCWSKNNLGWKEKSSIFKLWNGVNQK